MEEEKEAPIETVTLVPQKTKVIFPDFYIVGEDKKSGNKYEVHSSVFNVFVIGVVSMLCTLFILLSALIGAVGIVLAIDVFVNLIESIL